MCGLEGGHVGQEGGREATVTCWMLEAAEGTYTETGWVGCCALLNTIVEVNVQGGAFGAMSPAQVLCPRKTICCGQINCVHTHPAN